MNIIPKHKSMDSCFGIFAYSFATLVAPHGRGDPHIPKQDYRFMFWYIRLEGENYFDKFSCTSPTSTSQKYPQLTHKE